MHRVSLSVSAQLRRLLVRTASVAAFCATVTAHASDGLAISGSPPAAAVVGQAYSFTPSVSDPSHRTLKFAIANRPSWATFSSTTGRLAGTPSAASVGTQADIVIYVTDGIVSTHLPEFSIETIGTAKASISGTPPTSVTVGQAYSFTPTVSDPSRAPLSFTISNKPAWATFSATTGTLAGTPTAANIGTQADILIRVRAEGLSAQLPEFSIKVLAASTSATDKPVISGAPSTSVAAGSTFKFQPNAKDPDGKELSFSVKNKPAWATFSISSGLLDGTPTSSQTGTYSNIVISASNGQYTSSLPAFSVVVLKAPATTATGSAMVGWTAPTENTNGTKLTDLAGVRIYYGTSAGNLNRMVQVAGTTETSTTISNLASGVWYFSAVAYTTAGTQSDMSNVVSANIP